MGWLGCSCCAGFTFSPASPGSGCSTTSTSCRSRSSPGPKPPVRTGMIAGGLVSRALWWFRWGAMITFITGWLYLLHIVGQSGPRLLRPAVRLGDPHRRPPRQPDVVQRLVHHLAGPAGRHGVGGSGEGGRPGDPGGGRARRARRASRHARTPCCRSRCSSSWARPATSRFFDARRRGRRRSRCSSSS